MIYHGDHHWCIITKDIMMMGRHMMMDAIWSPMKYHVWSFKIYGWWPTMICLMIIHDIWLMTSHGQSPMIIHDLRLMIIHDTPLVIIYHPSSWYIIHHHQTTPKLQNAKTRVKWRPFEVVWVYFWSSRRALSDGSGPGSFWSDCVRLRSYRYEKSPCKELYRIGRVCHFTVKECGGVRGGGSTPAGGIWGHLRAPRGTAPGAVPEAKNEENRGCPGFR